MIQVLTGANSFAISSEVRRIITEARAAHGDHGVVRRDGESLERAELDTLFAGTSLFAPQQTVILRTVSSNKPVWEALPAHLGRVDQDTHVVLVEPQPDKRTKTYKWLTAHADVREFKPLTERELLQWLQQLARRFTSSLAPDGARAMLERIGTDQWLLYQELKKLALAHAAVTPDVVTQFTEATPQATAFDLVDAAVRSNSTAVQSALADVRQTEDPYKFFGLLASQVYALAVASALNGRRPEDAAKTTGLHPFVLKKSLPIARLLPQASLRHMVAYLARADHQLKTSGGDPWTVIGTCVSKMASRPPVDA